MLVPHPWRGNTNKQWSHYQHEASLVHTNLQDAETILASCSRVPHLPSARTQILFEASCSTIGQMRRVDSMGTGEYSND